MGTLSLTGPTELVDMGQDDLCGLRGFETRVVDVEPVRVRDIKLAKLLGPAANVRRIDLFHHAPPLGRRLSLPKLGRRTLEPYRNEKRLSLFGEPLDLTKSSDLVKTHYVGKNDRVPMLSHNLS
jgi:hypothetical protein